MDDQGPMFSQQHDHLSNLWANRNSVRDAVTKNRASKRTCSSKGGQKAAELMRLRELRELELVLDKDLGRVKGEGPFDSGRGLISR